MRMAKDVIDSICASAQDMPKHLTDIAHFLYTLKSDLSLISNLLFNNFFVPAIVFPEQFGLWGSPIVATQQRNILVAISKLIQKVANGSPYL